MSLYSSRRARFSGALMVAKTNGAPIVDLPSSSNFTRLLDAARRRKYSTVCAQLASFRSSPGVKPSTSDGAGTAFVAVRVAARAHAPDLLVEGRIGTARRSVESRAYDNHAKQKN